MKNYGSLLILHFVFCFLFFFLFSFSLFLFPLHSLYPCVCVCVFPIFSFSSSLLPTPSVHLTYFVFVSLLHFYLLYRRSNERRSSLRTSYRRLNASRAQTITREPVTLLHAYVHARSSRTASPIFSQLSRFTR